MFLTRVNRVVLASLALLMMISVPLSADIFRYVDENGVWHFTNIKTDVRYKFYLRETKKTSAQYIKKYEGIIDQAAKQFGVPHTLIKAVIKAESDYDHKAISGKGAQGLMQLMPETAEALKVDNPMDPEDNIFGGTRYLGMLLKQFKNNKEMALAAYNAGPKKVVHHKGIPPFPETQRFVKKVMNYYYELNRATD